MPSQDYDPRELGKKNRRVVLGMVGGFILIFGYIALLADYFPKWVDVIVVGILWFCAVELVTANIVGISKRKKRPYWDEKSIGQAEPTNVKDR